MECITQRPWAVAHKQSEGTAKGMRVIKYIDHWVLKLTYLDYMIDTKTKVTKGFRNQMAQGCSVPSTARHY